jgi:hypothetical protein
LSRRCFKFRHLIAFGIVALLAAAEPRRAAAHPMQPLARPQVYVDESGDAPIAPDIVSVVVTNDDAGLLTLGVSFANRTGLLPCDVLVVGLDVDRNKRTGGPIGMDYALSATTAAAELGVWSSSSWSGSGYVPIPGAASFSLSDHSVVLSTSVDQLGALMALQRPQLRFVVIALASTDRPEQNWTDDVAGPWTYRLRPPTKASASKASRERERPRYDSTISAARRTISGKRSRWFPGFLRMTKPNSAPKRILARSKA